MISEDLQLLKLLSWISVDTSSSFAQREEGVCTLGDIKVELISLTLPCWKYKETELRMAGRHPAHAAYEVFLFVFACQQVVFYGAKAFHWHLISLSQPLPYRLNSFCLLCIWFCEGSDVLVRPGLFLTPHDSVLTAPVFSHTTSSDFPLTSSSSISCT